MKNAPTNDKMDRVVAQNVHLKIIKMGAKGTHNGGWICMRCDIINSQHDYSCIECGLTHEASAHMTFDPPLISTNLKENDRTDVQINGQN